MCKSTTHTSKESDHGSCHRRHSDGPTLRTSAFWRTRRLPNGSQVTELGRAEKAADPQSPKIPGSSDHERPREKNTGRGLLSSLLPEHFLHRLQACTQTMDRIPRSTMLRMPSTPSRRLPWMQGDEQDAARGLPDHPSVSSSMPSIQSWPWRCRMCTGAGPLRAG